MRDAVVTMKELMSGEMVSFGSDATSRMRHGGESPPPPVYIAATGPRVMRVSGEVADGALLMTGIHPGAVAEAARDRLRRRSAPPAATPMM